MEKVRDGEVLAALIVPENFLDRLQAQLNGAGLESATVEVFVNEDDPVKAQAGRRPDQLTARPRRT